MPLTNLDDWLNYQQNLHDKIIDLGLDRITQVYKKLFPLGVDFKVITIAGTNGKGSTGCFLANIFNNAKIDYGWFSSPHIDKYNERFVINNNLATDLEIITSFEKIEKVRGAISLSYFEFSTLAALLIFSAKNIKVAILEIGLGGRLDSVNVVANDVAIITSIALDHQQYLGDSIEEIAFEKAGIIDKNCLIPNNLPTISKKIITNKKANIKIVEKYQKPLTMQGVWQQYNAALAQNAALSLFSIPQNIIDNSLQNTKFIARAEFVEYENKTFIFDTAHNIEAVKNLTTIIPDASIAIFAALEDKDIKQMIKTIAPKIKHWYLLPLIDNRALTTEKLSKYFEHNYDNYTQCIDKNQCFTKVIFSKYKNIVVFGSFLTINNIRCMVL